MLAEATREVKATGFGVVSQFGVGALRCQRPGGQTETLPRDEPLGTLTTTGRWENEGTRLLLRAEKQLRDGKPVDTIDRTTEVVSVTRAGDEWSLTAGGRQFTKAGTKPRQ